MLFQDILYKTNNTLFQIVFMAEIILQRLAKQLSPYQRLLMADRLSQVPMGWHFSRCPDDQRLSRPVLHPRVFHRIWVCPQMMYPVGFHYYLMIIWEWFGVPVPFNGHT